MSAIISACGLFRYRLERQIQDAGIVVALLGVNPSTADATVDDATIRKDIGFGMRNGWRRIIKGNPFAFRATDVRALGNAVDPIGPENNAHLRQILADADLIVPCWGSRRKLPRLLRYRLIQVARMVAECGKPVRIFGLTKGADPLHPLMLGYSTQLVEWQTIERVRATTGDSSDG